MDTSLPSAFLPILPRNTDDADFISTIADALNRLETLLSISTQLDTIEQAFATSWLQRILTRSLTDDILDRAAVLITSLEALHAKPEVTLSGHNPSSGGRYEINGSRGPISVKIRDGHMGNDVHATGFCTWTSAIYLARYMAEHPQTLQAIDEWPLRVLELGSGTGYAGIAIAKLLQDRNIRSIVTLSDYDDATLERLRANASANSLTNDADAPVRSNVRKLDWSDLSGVQEAEFDVVLTADTVYEPDHGPLLLGVIRQVLHPNGAFHAVVPHRPTHRADIEAYERAFRAVDEGLGGEWRPVITYSERLRYDDDDPHPYVYYRIEWQS